MANIEYELNERIHAIIINPYLTWENFCSNCDLIKKYNIKNISTSLNYLDDFKNRLSNYSANINALISYPLADLPVTFIEELVNFNFSFSIASLALISPSRYLAQVSNTLNIFVVTASAG